MGFKKKMKNQEQIAKNLQAYADEVNRKNSKPQKQLKYLPVVGAAANGIVGSMVGGAIGGNIGAALGGAYSSSPFKNYNKIVNRSRIGALTGGTLGAVLASILGYKATKELANAASDKFE